MKKKHYPTNQPCYHHATDGRGVRKVYLNGELIDQVISADTKRGFVVICTGIIRGKILTKKLHGKVVVKYVQKSHYSNV